MISIDVPPFGTNPDRLGAEPALVHSVRGPSPHPDHAAVPDLDVQPAAVGTQYTGRLHPPVHVLLRDTIAQRLVDAHRPDTAGCKRVSFPPRIRDRISVALSSQEA